MQPHITVCICTFRRPALLRRLLQSLYQQETRGHFTFSAVVSDNDRQQSGRSVVEELNLSAPIKIIYCSEPRQNIALARNRALEHADGTYIAFIDDDEFPAADWLLEMLAACTQFRASGILGPVRPHFDTPPPQWIVKGGFCERPEPPTGTIMDWDKSRTGNLLFKREILPFGEAPFKEEFGTGGEDKDFFMRMTQSGCIFVWSKEGVVYESVPPERWTRSYMLQRAMLRGKNILKHPGGKIQLLLTSVVAAPLYFAVLPVTLLFGQHWFMKYAIKFCDHFGRILSALKLNPINERSA